MRFGVPKGFFFGNHYYGPDGMRLSEVFLTHHLDGRYFQEDGAGIPPGIFIFQDTKTKERPNQTACHELKNGDEHEPAEANTSPDFDWFHFHQVEQTPHHGTPSGHWLRRRWSGCAHQLDEWLEPAISWTCHTWLLIYWWNSVVWATICDATYWIIEHRHWVLIWGRWVWYTPNEPRCGHLETAKAARFFLRKQERHNWSDLVFPTQTTSKLKITTLWWRGSNWPPRWREHHWLHMTGYNASLKTNGASPRCSCSFDVQGYLRLPLPFSQKNIIVELEDALWITRLWSRFDSSKYVKDKSFEQSPEVLRLKSMRGQYWTYQSSGQMWTTTSGMKSFQDPSNMSCVCFGEEIKWMYMKHGPEAIFRAILWIIRQKLWWQTCSLFCPGLKHQRPRTGWANAGWHPHQHLWMSRTRGMCE